MQNILITGCSSGFGLALAEFYLKRDYRVYGVARRTPPIDHPNFIFQAFDLAKIESIKEGLTPFIQSIEEIDIVYLNAGVLGEVKSSFDVSVEQMQAVYNINVYANKELLDILSTFHVKVIIGISSGAAKNGSKGWASYSLSKAGLNMLFNLYSKEMNDTHLLSVAPGVIETPMVEHICNEVDDEEFPSAKRLKEGEIQSPQEAVIGMHNVIEKRHRFESGSFIDVREV